MADEDPTNQQRLAEHVVARRVQLGYKKRPAFSEASGISTRILGDIETGRRGNFDATTIAALENALGWVAGSTNRILSGGDPTLRGTGIDGKARIGDDTHLIQAKHHTDEGYSPRDDPALVRVMRSDLPDAKKRQLVKMLIAERVAAERQRMERAEQLIELVASDE